MDVPYRSRIPDFKTLGDFEFDIRYQDEKIQFRLIWPAQPDADETMCDENSDLLWLLLMESQRAMRLELPPDDGDVEDEYEEFNWDDERARKIMKFSHAASPAECKSMMLRALHACTDVEKSGFFNIVRLDLDMYAEEQDKIINGSFGVPRADIVFSMAIDNIPDPQPHRHLRR